MCIWQNYYNLISAFCELLKKLPVEKGSEIDMNQVRWRSKDKFKSLSRLGKFIFQDGFYVNRIIRWHCSSVFEFWLCSSLQIILTAQYNVFRKIKDSLHCALNYSADQKCKQKEGIWGWSLIIPYFTRGALL